MRKALLKQGFCGRLYFVDFVASWILITVCLTLVLCSGLLNITDLSPLNTMIEKSFEQLAIFTGFIVWKSKVENCRKYKDVNLVETLESEVE